MLGSRMTAPEGTSRAGLPSPDQPPRAACDSSGAASTFSTRSAAAVPAPGRAVSAGAAWGKPALAGTCLVPVVPVPLREVLCGRGSPSPAAASAAAAPPMLLAGAEVGGLVSCVASSPAGGAAPWCHRVFSTGHGAGGAAFTSACLAAVAGRSSCLQKVQLEESWLPTLCSVAPSSAGGAICWQCRAHSCCG